MSMHTAATSPRLANNPYPDQLNPGHAAEGSTPPELTDHPTAPPIVSQVSRSTPHFSIAVVGQQIASGTTTTNTNAVTTTTTTNTATTTTTTTTTVPTYSNRKSSTRDPSAGRPDSVRQMLQLKNAGISLLHDAILRSDYTYALQLMDEGDLPCTNFLPLETKRGSRNPAVTKLVFAGKGIGSPDLQPIISAFAVQVLNQCPTESRVVNNVNMQVNQVNYYGANALTLAITSGAPIDFVKALCEKAVKNDPEFINRCDGAGRTALCMAAEQGDLALIDVLVAAGAKLGAANWHSQHAVVQAARRGDTVTLNKLLSYVSVVKDQRFLLDALNRLSSQSAIFGLAKALHLNFRAMRQDISDFIFTYLNRLPAESVAKAFTDAGIICLDEHKCMLITNYSDPQSLAILLDAVGEKFVLTHIRSLRRNLQPQPALYDTLALRDPAFQALLTQSTFSDADIEELSRFLADARLAGATDWMERLIRMGAVPDMEQKPFYYLDDRPKILAYMAEIDHANFHPCFKQFKAISGEENSEFESEMLKSLKQTCTATGLERLIGWMDEYGIDLIEYQSLAGHAVKLGSIIAIERLVSTGEVLVSESLVASAQSEEMRTILTQLRSSATHYRGTAFESDSGSGSESEPETESEHN